MRSTFSLSVVALWVLSSSVEAHTWLENIMLVGSNGSFVGNPGYPRGYGPRTAGVDPNAQNVNLIPPNGRAGNAYLPTDLMCKSTQTIGTYTSGYGPISAAPQDTIALRYLENGHVTKQVGQTRPAHNGTIFVYGTTQPANTDTYLGIHRVWNADGTGGDKRGKLIATRTFDDGRCFQVNGLPLSNSRKAAVNWPDGSDLECQTDVQIPADAGTSGNYTMYWVWEWPQLDPKTGAITSNESYTACLDVMMTSKSAAGGGLPVSKLSTSQQITGSNAGLVGIEAQLGTQFIVDPSAKPQVTAGAAFSSNASPAVASSTAAASSAPASSAKASSAQATSAAPATTSAPAANGFVTVTITESAQETTTVTVTQDIPASSGLSSHTASASSATSTTITLTATTAIATSTATVIPLPASTFVTSASASVAAGAIPSPAPFLGAGNNVVSGRRVRVKGRGVRL
ncbi:hypothetical protein EG329_004768 [Mollisiaceae sp. DMI_Dod_QoI]|nr:hypothetical protein EG329_004768 [Helotiales sp. DMI_Dod_QoI]